MKTLIHIFLIFGYVILVDGQSIYKADSLYQVGDYQNAYSFFAEELKIDSSNISQLAKAGNCAFQLGKFKNAKSHYLTLESLDGGNITAAKNLAKIYEYEGHEPKTIKYYLKLSEVYPDNSVYLRKLAANYLKGGATTEAYQYYEKAYINNPDDVHTLIGMTDMLIAKNQLEKADSVLRLALDYDPENIKLNLSFAASKYRQRQYDTVCIVLPFVAGRVDLNNYYNKMLGFSYIQIDSLDLAIYHLEKSLVDERMPEKAHYYLATAYQKKEDIETAIFHYSKAVESGKSAKLALYHHQMAILYKETNKLKNTILNYKEAYRYTDDPVYLFYLARISEAYYKDKNIALRYYTKYLKNNPENKKYKEYAIAQRSILKENIHFNN